MLNATPFGIADPVFGRDIGYYVFTLPGIGAMLGYLTAVTVISMLLSVPLHFLSGHIVVAPQTFRVHPTAARHFSILLALLLAIAAVELWVIDIPGLLYSTTGPLIGASYTDLHARLPALRLSALAALAAAIVILVGNARGQSGRYAIRAVLGYIIFAAVARGIVPQLVQKFIVSPTELTRETPYLRSHITATRQAWGLDSVELRELNGETSLTLADIQANGPTVENVRLWDRDPLLQTFGQLQEIRTYYDFVSVDDDRYHIDGKYRQVLLSPRELNASSLPTRTFINEHLTFTHGMGLTLAPVNQVTAEGLPVLFVKDLPPASIVSITVTRPQLY